MKITRFSALALCLLCAFAACKNEPAEQAPGSGRSNKLKLKGFWYQYTNTPMQPKTVYQFGEDGSWYRYAESPDSLKAEGTYDLDSVKLKLSYTLDANKKQDFLVDAVSDSLLVMEAMDGADNGQTVVLKHWGDNALSIAKMEGTIGKDPLTNQSFKLAKQANILVRVESEDHVLTTELLNKGGAVIRSDVRSAWAGELLPGEYILRITGSTNIPVGSKDKLPAKSADNIKYKVLIDQVK